MKMVNKTNDAFAAASREKVEVHPAQRLKEQDEERILYRGPDGETLSLATAAKEMLLNTIIPYRKRALLAEGQRREQRDEMVQKIKRAHEDADRQFEEDYGKPNNYGGLRGFVLTAVNIKDIEVVWDNEAVIVRFGDRRIAPRFKEWLDDHRNVLPENERPKSRYGEKPKDVKAERVKLANGALVYKGQVIWINVMDQRGSIQMKVTNFARWPDGEYAVRGLVPPKDGVTRFLTDTPSRHSMASVHERRVIG